MDYALAISEVLKGQCSVMRVDGAFNLLLTMATSDHLMGQLPHVGRPIIHPNFRQSFLTLLENHMKKIIELPIDTVIMISNDIDRSEYDKGVADHMVSSINRQAAETCAKPTEVSRFYFILDPDEDVNLDRHGRAVQLGSLWEKMFQNIVKSNSVSQGPMKTVLLDIFDTVPRWAVRLPKWLHRPSSSTHIRADYARVAEDHKHVEPVVEVSTTTKGVEPDIVESRLSEMIQEANDAARMARRERRSRVVPGLPPPLQAQQQDALPLTKEALQPNRRQRRSIETLSRHEMLLRRKEATRQKEATQAFLKQCGQALLQEGAAVHGEAQPEYIENRLRASLKKVEKVSKQKEKMQKILEERKKVAVIFGV